MHPEVQLALSGATPDATPDLSVVLPCYDEQDNVGPLIDELHRALAPLGRQFEILCVDDASRDRTLEALRAAQRLHAEVRVLRHARHCGQSAAFASGFGRARGATVITMDSDRQNDPADIPALLAALEGVDVVCGVRARRTDGWVRRVSSRVGNGFRNLVTGVPVTDSGCSYRVLRAGVLAELPVFNGMHRFLPTLLRLQGFVIREVPVRHRARPAGRSKYGIRNRALRGVLDCFAMRWFKARAVPAVRLVPDEEPPR